MKKALLIFLLSVGFKAAMAQFTTIQVVGPNDVCNGSGILLEVVNPQPGYTYNWFIGSYGCSFPGIAFPYGFPGITLTAWATGEYFCYGMPPAGPPEISNPEVVRILPGSAGSILMPAPAMGTSVNCVSSASLCVPYVYYQNWPGTLIKWYKDNVLIPGAISAGYTATSTGYYKYSVTSGCLTAFSDSSYVTILPAAQFTANASGTVCPGQLINYSVTNPQPGTTYTWKALISGLYQIAGTGNSLNYSAPASGSVSVLLQALVVNSGCSFQSNPHILTVGAYNAAISAGGPVTFCKGGQVTLSTTPSTGSFTWFKNNVIISGATAPTYSATTGGSYTCFVSNGNGCQDTSNAIGVTVNSLPGAAVTAQGATVFCQGGSVLLQTSANAGNTYQWKRNGTLISGATANAYVASVSGTYKVTVTKTSTGCSQTTATGIPVTVYSLPSATVTPQGPTTFCAGGSVTLAANTGNGFTYKWKKGGLYISAATSQNYTASTAGTYKVEVTNSHGCTKTSLGVSVSVPCRNEPGMPVNRVFSIGVHPNPSNGSFQVSIWPEPLTTACIRIYDLSGRKASFEFQWLDSANGIIDGLAPGIYTAEFLIENEIIYRKLILTGH